MSSEPSSVSDDEWRAFVATRADATVYHTPDWRPVASAIGHRSLPIAVRDSRGAVAGVLPLFEVGSARSRRLTAVPLRDRGGPLGVDAEATVRLMRAAADVAAERGAGRVTLRSHVPLLAEAEAAGYVESRYHVTTLVDLRGGEDAVAKAVKGSARRSAVHGQEAGLAFRWGTGLDDLRAFYGLFLRTRRKLGVPPYPWRFFSAMHDHLGPDVARVAIASHDGRDVAAVLLLAHGDRVIDGYAASDERYLSLQPNDFLIWSVLGSLAREGFATFDFGASSPHQTGLLFFKEKWGGRHVDLYTYDFPAAAPARDSNRPEYDRVRAAWARLPLWATRMLGGPIVRRLD